jgi:lipoate-protein ligase A
MRRLILTLSTPAENVALDEALLDWAEEDATDREVLRIWESAQPLVIAGRSSRIAQEINTAECEERHIPIVRRSSGGAAIVAGPGCLMYAVVLSYQARPELRDISRAHFFVLNRLATAIRDCGVEVARAGTSDLVISDCGLRIADLSNLTSQSEIRNPKSEIARKFSGNSLRVKRNHFLYHGTLLYNFDMKLMTSCLRMPPRQPDYRGARQHLDFVTNVPLSRPLLIEALDAAWPSTGELTDVPLPRVSNLVANRFGRDDWNYEFG